MLADFNPDMMVLGRTLKDLNQTDLADLTGKTQAYVSKIEQRMLSPSDEFVDSLSDKLELPKTFFYQSGHLAGVPTSVHAFFRKTTPKAKVLSRLNAEISLRILHLRIIKDRLPAYMAAFNALIEAISPQPNQPEEAARKFRQYHNVERGVIPNLTHLVEASGILIFPCDFGDETNESVDGVSMNVPHLPPTIFLNKSRPADRMRFSLAHELFHVLAHRVPSDTMEQEANRFAAELLMPAEDIRVDLSESASLNTLAALKPKWKASIASLLYRAGELEIINQNQKNNLWRQINQRGWKKQEPASLDLEPESVSLVQNIFFSDPNVQLSDLLHLYNGKIEEMYQTKLA